MTSPHAPAEPPKAAPPAATWRRFDTLFLRLFALIWVALVLSHTVAFGVVGILLRPPDEPLRSLTAMPVLGSLPPGPLQGPMASPPPRGAPSHAGPAPAGTPQRPPAHGPLPASGLWLDYAVRFVLIGLAAFVGARWLSRPVHRLAQAAHGLSLAATHGTQAAWLDERQGTQEVRETAQVFNQMALRLQQQFDARGLHMAAISHDLRTPLTRLRMRLAQWPEDDRQQAAIADIHEMNTMIEETLAVLREQQRGSDVRRVDLGALVQALLDDLLDQGLTVTSAPLPSAKVQAHPAALRRIVGNLINNALQHGGSAHLILRAEAHRVVLEVQDNGPGMSTQQMERCFEPWVRLADDNAAAHQAGAPGYGLGLAIARDLAERDQAMLTLHNRAEGGLCAQLAWPKT